MLSRELTAEELMEAAGIIREAFKQAIKEAWDRQYGVEYFTGEKVQTCSEK